SPRACATWMRAIQSGRQAQEVGAGRKGSDERGGASRVELRSGSGKPSWKFQIPSSR
ncbi:hypothetical protein LTR28_014005, partial [Elasticomyces elasticus]